MRGQADDGSAEQTQHGREGEELLARQQRTPAAQTLGRTQRAPGCLQKVERRKGGINNEEQKVAHACCTHTQRKTVAQDCCTAATADPAALALLNTPPQQQNHPPVGEGLLWKAT